MYAIVDCLAFFALWELDSAGKSTGFCFTKSIIKVFLGACCIFRYLKGMHQPYVALPANHI